MSKNYINTVFLIEICMTLTKYLKKYKFHYLPTFHNYMTYLNVLKLQTISIFYLYTFIVLFIEALGNYVYD